ncbi:chondroitinase family polysaccharide lyase [Chryseobacterium vrystaatense]|uniref:Polysaccharide lyase family 8, C-terminal beta-sandwich domain n=1 Tax=Chryseobacterium vrystaatense TaxID=307480 RepID=A0A1M5DW56_9FLAO|nr:chondroitinase family polysaccharide lyase [Chryseobacterium vrystaatense]SHF71094.1 Polysaccharide lyase family 8, C-terminal beta-sandwich domain [Chryseobacterium vrystaatense]
MLKSVLYSFVLLSCSPFYAQLTEVNAVKTKYINWLTDNTVTTYSNTSVKGLYDRYIQFGNNAETNVVNNYDFNAPGPVWNMTNGTDNGAMVTLVNNHLLYLVMSYHLKGPLVNGQPSNPKYHSAAGKDLILKIFKYIKDKGINSTTNFNFGLNASQETVNINNSGFGLRCFTYAACVLLMKEELVQAGEFSHHMGVLGNLTSFLDPDNPNFHFTNPGFNTDVVRALIETRLCYVLGQDDSDADKLANMKFLVDFTDNALLIGNGWADFIKPDFTTYHHRGAYANSYGGDALFSMSIMNYILKGSAYELKQISQGHLKTALMSYRKFSADFEIPRGLAGRFPNSTTPLSDYKYAFALLYAADPVANADAGQFFKRMYNMSGFNRALSVKNPVMAGQIAVGINNTLTPDVPVIQGHFGFPYAGLSVHKYNGYQIAVKGTSKHIWHYENSDSENLFGRYTSAGAMEILSAGSPKTRLSNGLGVANAQGAVTDDGWDWAHIPGVTAAFLPLSGLSSGVSREFNGKNFLAHASLDNHGVFAMDYKDINSPTGMSVLKTVFFFKDKALSLGSDLKDAGGTNPIHTTVFQTGLPTASTATTINGVPQSGLNVNFSQSSGSVWATDAVGNGFVIPAGSYTGSVVIKRSTQQSRNYSNTADTQGDYTTAYIDHGTAPSSGRYRYGILLQGGTSATQNFADHLTDYFEVIQQNEKAHVVKFVEDNTYNYVIFDATSVFQSDAVISADKPSVVMTQALNAGSKLKVSLTNPNLGLLNDNEAFTYSQITGTASRLYRVPQIVPVKLKLAGKWKPEFPANNITTVITGNTTEVTFSTINGITIQTSLVPETFLNSLEAESGREQDVFTVYPNPAKENVKIVLKKGSAENIKIMDRAGNDITSKIKVTEHNNTLDLNLGTVEKGWYLICIGGQCRKLIKD